MKASWLQTESQCWGQEKSRLPQWNEKLITKKNLSAPFYGKLLCLHCWELSSIVRKQIVMVVSHLSSLDVKGERHLWWSTSRWTARLTRGSYLLVTLLTSRLPTPCWLCWQPLFTHLTLVHIYPMDCLTSCTFLIVEWQNTTCPSIFSETSATFQNFWRNNQFLTLVQNKEVLNGTKLYLHHLKSSTHLPFNMVLSTPST